MRRSLPWLRIGWRNLARNPKRTGITASGLAVGYFAVVFMAGWSGGIVDELIDNGTSLVSGQIEVHDAGYRPERNLHDTIGGRDGVDVGLLLQRIESDPAVTAAAPRAYAGALIGSGDSTAAGVLMGVVPDRETAVSRFLDRLAEGRLPRAGSRELVVGEEMARQLGAAVGDEIVLVAPGADGSIANDLYTLAGVFRTGLVAFDTAFVVMPLADLQLLVVLDRARIHEIAAATVNPKAAEAAALRLAESVGDIDPAIAVAPWSELKPLIVDYVGLVEGAYWIILVIVFTVAVFGVANTMLMATFERRREFAVIVALGATPRSIVGAVLSESVAIGVLSLAAGAALALPLMAWWHNAPPSLEWLYGNTSMGGVLLTPSLRVAYDPEAWIWASVALLLTALVAALYPAVRAARTPPADTLSGL